MAITPDTYPFRPADDDEKFWVETNCGGWPVEDVRYLDNFLRISGDPIVDRMPVSVILARTSGRLLQVMGLGYERHQAFDTEATLYASVVSSARQTQELPIEREVIIRVMTELKNRPLDFAEEVIDLGIAIFDRDNDILGPPTEMLIGTNREDMLAAEMGLGTMQYIVTKSVAVRSSINSLEEEFPELIGLLPSFDNDYLFYKHGQDEQ